MTLLRVAGLSTVYWTGHIPVRAVEDVSFDLDHGRSLGIVGESGSGKTTLAMSLLRLIKPPGKIIAGRVEFEGESIFDRPRARMREVRGARMSLIPQAAMNALNPARTALACVAECIRAHQPVDAASAHDRAAALLAAVQIPHDRFDAYPHELSGGMRQRTVIAMALANDPTLVIADEPVTGLDVIVQAQILELLRQLRSERGLSMIFISHDLPVVASVCDSLMVMKGGRAVESGGVTQLMSTPSHDYTRKLLAATPWLDAPATPYARGRAPTRARTHRPEGQGSRSRVPVLELCDVRKSFARHQRGIRRGKVVHAVDGVTLTIAEGEIVGLIGESGSGKSTIARLVLGLVPSDAGNIRFDGASLEGLPEREWRQHRRRMHLIFQDPYEALSRRMRVRDLVAEPLKIHRLWGRPDSAQRIREALTEANLLPIDTYENRFPGELSGGQRQRVALARSLVMRPRLIIADEPTSMLDASLRLDLLATMAQVRERHDTAFLFITHDLALVRGFCDRVAVLHRGRIVEVGPTAQVVTTPQHPYTQELVKAVRDLQRPPTPPPERNTATERQQGDVTETQQQSAAVGRVSPQRAQEEQ